MSPQRISQLRTKARLTQDQMGKLFGVSQPLIAQWENGTRIPDPIRQVMLDRLADQVKHTEEIDKWRNRLTNVIVGGLAVGLTFLFTGDDSTEEDFDDDSPDD